MKPNIDLATTPKQAGFDWAVTFRSNGTSYGRKVNRNDTTVKPSELVDAYCASESVRFLRERDKKLLRFSALQH